MSYRRSSATHRFWRKYSTGLLFVAALGAVLIFGMAISEAAPARAASAVVLHFQGNVSDTAPDGSQCTGLGAHYVLGHDRMVCVSLGGPGEVGEKIEKSKRLARKALARL